VTDSLTETVVGTVERENDAFEIYKKAPNGHDMDDQFRIAEGA
jgi:hypothetical protein